MSNVLTAPTELNARTEARAETPSFPRSTSLIGSVGGTPLVEVGPPVTAPGSRFWAKLEGFNPGGIKDRSALHMVRCARDRGELLPGEPIIESTSGTLGLGLALAGIAYGHPVRLVVDPGLESFVRNLLIAHGATIDTVRRPAAVGGWQQARKARVQRLLARHPGAWCPNQYDNPDNVAAYAGLAAELAADAGQVDVLVAAVGTGGHSVGVARELRRSFPWLRLVGVDSINSTIFGQPGAPRLMRGLGSSIYPRNVDYSAFDEVHWVAPEEAVHTVRELAESHYATGGWSVGAVALAARWVAERNRDARVVAIFPDGPHRYWNTVFNAGYRRRHGLDERNRPVGPATVSSAAERVVTSWTRCVNVTDPRELGVAS